MTRQEFEKITENHIQCCIYKIAGKNGGYATIQRITPQPYCPRISRCTRMCGYAEKFRAELEPMINGESLTVQELNNAVKIHQNCCPYKIADSKNATFRGDTCQTYCDGTLCNRNCDYLNYFKTLIKPICYGKRRN